MLIPTLFVEPQEVGQPQSQLHPSEERHLPWAEVNYSAARYMNPFGLGVFPRDKRQTFSSPGVRSGPLFPFGGVAVPL